MASLTICKVIFGDPTESCFFLHKALVAVPSREGCFGPDRHQSRYLGGETALHSLTTLLRRVEVEPVRREKKKGRNELWLKRGPKSGSTPLCESALDQTIIRYFILLLLLVLFSGRGFIRKLSLCF